MGAKTFRDLRDFVRHGVNIYLTCANGHCSHVGVAESWACMTWFRLHRWSTSLEWGALDHFRCTRCGARAGAAHATDKVPTVDQFFPVDEKGWQAQQRRLRG